LLRSSNDRVISFLIMTPSITLGTSAPSGSLRVILLPAGAKPPTEIAAALNGATVSRKFSRTVFDAEGQATVVLGLEKTPNTAQLRIAAAKAVKAMRDTGTKAIAIDTSLLPEDIDARATGRAFAEGICVGNYDTKPFAGAASKKSDAKPVKVSLDARFHKGFQEGLVLGRAVNSARALVNTPPNLAGPSHMADHARALAKTYKMVSRVIDATEAAKLGMGGLLAVGAGSADAPRLIVLDWNPSGKKTAQPVLLVGKTVTYDSGGYSLKPDGGKGMKSDKSGGCTMLGVMEAIAQMKVKTRVVCILAAAENMVDAKAFRLDDVITHYNGVTCEITNTDAEGRLVLADALAWGTETYKPSAVIDAATLTGGVVVALGKTITGVFSNDDALMGRLQEAANVADEQVWRLPLDDSFREKMKAGVADLHNSAAARWAHAITGAAYLSFFVGDDAPKAMPTTPWLHLDIAGTATAENDADWEGLFPKGPTGWGVRTLTTLLANWEKR
jgi:leucyl aminopeptidase